MTHYEKQVRILLRVLPLIEYDHPESGAPFMALKGGTALNFLLWNLPRLSVDIDLAYCPIDDREIAVRDITASMQRLAERVKTLFHGASVSLTAANPVPKLLIQHDGVMVKIEPNATIRGTVYQTEFARLPPEVERRFGMGAEVRRLSVHDLYGGKICAALDRQHPRDLFDIGQLLDSTGITENTRAAFLVYLISHNRPMAELLDPQFQPLGDIYEREFRGMTGVEISLEQLEHIGARLVSQLRSNLSAKDKEFILSVKNGAPAWELLGVAHAVTLPAVRWKLHNIEQLMQNPGKHEAALAKLRSVLELG